MSDSTTKTRPQMPQPDGPRNKPLSARAGMSRLSAWRTIWERSGMLLVFVALVVVCSIWVPKFPSLRNMDALFLAIATIGIIACTMLFCLASGDFDLSVGSVVALSGVVAALVTNFTGSVVLGILSGMLAGALVGLANGFVIAFLGINALITTLATMQIARGLGLLAGGGGPVGVGNAGFYVLGTSSLHDIPWLRWLGDTGNVGAWLLGLSSPIWIVLVCFIIFGLLLKKTIFGRNTLAIGGNKEAAMLAGIPVRLTKIVIFSLQGMVAGFAGVVQASQMNMGDPDVSKGLELQVISACVLGGVSLTGGVGTMTGVVMGVLIMGIVENAMTLLNMPTFWQYVTSGSILLAAVLFDRLKQRRAV